MFTIVKAEDYQCLSRRAANLIAAQILLKPESVLGLATGSSPVGTYLELRAKYQAGDLDFSRVTSINLDEYKGLSPEHEQSYRYFMNQNLFDHVNIRKECTFVPDGLAEDDEKACREYDAIIERCGGVDLQLLGIGHDGHIGFNEPSDEFPKGTHCVKLEDITIESNKRFFASKEEVPTHAYTMGIGSIFSARRILLIVSGKDKAEILKKSLFGPVCPQVPASILQLHPNVTVIADAEAMSAIEA